MQKSHAYISKWCVREAGKALKQVLVVVILDNRGSICLRDRERKKEGKKEREEEEEGERALIIFTGRSNIRSEDKKNQMNT